MFERALRLLSKKCNYKVKVDTELTLTEENLRKLDDSTSSYNINNINNINNITQEQCNIENNIATFDLSTHSKDHSVDSSTSSSFRKLQRKSFLNYYTNIMRRKLRSNIIYLSNDEEPSLVCYLCNNPFENGICTLLPCDHGFHYTCINNWLKKTQSCPICGLQLTNDIPTKEYIQEKYSYEYLKQMLLELGLIDNDDIYQNEDKMMEILIEILINYFKKLYNNQSLKRKSSSDSITISEE